MRTPASRCVGCATAAFALFLGFASAQTSSKEKSPQATPASADTERPVATFRAHTDLVLIPVTVTDTLNRFVLGLQKQDFQLFEDDVEQNLTLFSGEDAPLSVGVLFDESGSMGDKLRTSRDAAVQLVNTLDKEDEAFFGLLRWAIRLPNTSAPQERHRGTDVLLIRVWPLATVHAGTA